MRSSIAIMAAALVIAAICGVGLAWDGSYYLFRTLDVRVPYVAHERFQDFFLYLPALGASYVTDNFGILRIVTGLSLISIPVTSLTVSWLIVRKYSPKLFLWPVLCLCLGLLPGQLALNFEGIQAVQLFWPVLLGVIVRLPQRVIPAVVAFTALTFIAHPTASVLLGFGAVGAALLGYQHSEDRAKLWICAQGLAFLALVRFLLIWHDSYDQGQVSFSTLGVSFQNSLSGAPLTALIWVWVSSAVLLVADYWSVRLYGWVSALLRFYSAFGIGAAAWCLLNWALDPTQWVHELDFRDLAMFCSLPFMGFALIEGSQGRALPPVGFGGADMRFRIGMVQAAATVFFAVFTVQSVEFNGAVSQLSNTLAKTTAPCLSLGSLSDLLGTPLNHWSVSSLAILEQSRKPTTVVLMENGCQDALRTGQVQLIWWDPSSYQTQWFDLSSVETRLAAEADRLRRSHQTTGSAFQGR